MIISTPFQTARGALSKILAFYIFLDHNTQSTMQFRGLVWDWLSLACSISNLAVLERRDIGRAGLSTSENTYVHPIEHHKFCTYPQNDGFTSFSRALNTEFKHCHCIKRISSGGNWFSEPFLVTIFQFSLWLLFYMDLVYSKVWNFYMKWPLEILGVWRGHHGLLEKLKNHFGADLI